MRPFMRRWFGTSALGCLLLVGCNQAPRQMAYSRTHMTHAATVKPSHTEGVTSVPMAPTTPQTGTLPTEQRPTTLPPAPTALKTDKEVQPTAHVEPPAAEDKKEKVMRRNFADITAKSCYDHASDYCWLKGELQFVHSRNVWKLRYASVDEEDRYGGSVTLAETGSMGKFTNGQTVRVEGQLIDVDSREVGPTYRVRSIETLANP